ncbi:hypothetical protein M569_16856 [Genlisea aurea]|uniref:O-fucosyltransferase family protein n=1 Tax=Genlisea aurea TaxID=192259 RepID=S8C0K9_9LAMI|nr:hypothetical protein M569_16856 [Genlisea aurea]
MAVDPRHALAGVLTLTMFVMLADMVKRDLSDSAYPGIHNSNKASEGGVAGGDIGPWKEDGSRLKPCWEKPAVEEADESQGYVTFSLTTGPEYHVSQIADAVVVARYLRANLVIPDIRGSKPGDKRKFEDVYDTDKLIASLDGVVKVLKSQPASVSANDLAVVKIPNRVTEEYIARNVETEFRDKGNVRLVTYFPSANMKRSEGEKKASTADSVACLAMFESLVPQPEVQGVIDSVIDRLRSLSRESGHFVAIDVRIDMLKKKGCRKGDGSRSKSCFNPQEIALFLKKIGFGKDTVLYVTQTKWDSSLDALKDLFPNTYTKKSIMGNEKEMDDDELEKAIDMYICSESDVFVPAISGLFYANVAGKRIASGKTQILVPAVVDNDVPTPSARDFLSHYVLEKNHLAYSCFC